MSSASHVKSVKSQFRTKVLVTDDSISVEGEGAPNVVGLFKGKSETVSSMNKYNCDLADLPMILLQQVSAFSVHFEIGLFISWLTLLLHIIGLSTLCCAGNEFLSFS